MFGPSWNHHRLTRAGPQVLSVCANTRVLAHVARLLHEAPLLTRIWIIRAPRCNVMASIVLPTGMPETHPQNTDMLEGWLTVDLWQGMRTEWPLFWWKQCQSKSKDGHHGNWLVKKEAGAHKGVMFVAYVGSVLDGSGVWIHTWAEVQENIS